MNVIAHNVLAMNAQRQFQITGTKAKKNVEKLSSGYRINRAADDAAGLSISEKMRRQIRGLDQGSENIQDGISYVQIGDGAMEEVSSMLLRMEQLAVQAANGTNSESDREAINNEVIQLKKEINRVSRTTKFNEQNVFDNNGIIALDVQGIAEDMNFFNSEYDAATGDVKYGGFLFHGRRISWDTIDPDMVYLDSAGEQRFKAGSYTYEDGQGYTFHVTCDDETRVPEVTREFSIKADGRGITIDGKNFGWRELVDEEGNYSKNGKFHEGVWSLNYEGATVNFVLLEEVDSFQGMVEAINSMRDGRMRYQWIQQANGSIGEKAVDMTSPEKTQRITSALASMYTNELSGVLRTRVDADGIWLQYQEKDPTSPVDAPRWEWKDVGGSKADSLMTWQDMGIWDWDDGKFIKKDFVYRYSDDDGANDTEYTFTYELSDVTSLDSVIDGLDQVVINRTDISTTYTNYGNQTNINSAANPSKVLSMSATINNTVYYEEERRLGRNFEAKDTDVQTKQAQFDGTSQTASIDFKDGMESVLTYSGNASGTINAVRQDVIVYTTELLNRMTDLALKGNTDPRSEIKSMTSDTAKIGQYTLNYSASHNRGISTRYQYNYTDVLDGTQVTIEAKNGKEGDAGAGAYVKLQSAYNGYQYVLASEYAAYGAAKYGQLEYVQLKDGSYVKTDTANPDDYAQNYVWVQKIVTDASGAIQYEPESQIDRATYEADKANYKFVREVASPFSDYEYRYGLKKEMVDSDAYAKNAVGEMVNGFELTLHASDYSFLTSKADEKPNQAIRTTFASDIVKTVKSAWGPSIQCSGEIRDQTYMSKFALDVYALGLQSANTKTAEESTRLIDLVGEAQKYVSAKRSLFGAYQNRLEHTYAIRSQMKEDTTAAESRIRDTDMAEEMVAYSANKVLLQAGQSMIAQANQQGDGVLRLLA